MDEARLLLHISGYNLSIPENMRLMSDTAHAWTKVLGELHTALSAIQGAPKS
jgi:hypothetical protein